MEKIENKKHSFTLETRKYNTEISQKELWEGKVPAPGEEEKAFLGLGRK